MALQLGVAARATLLDTIEDDHRLFAPYLDIRPAPSRRTVRRRTRAPSLSYGAAERLDSGNERGHKAKSGTWAAPPTLPAFPETGFRLKDLDLSATYAGQCDRDGWRRAAGAR